MSDDAAPAAVDTEPDYDAMSTADLVRESGLSLTDFLDDTLRADKSLAAFKDIGALAKSYVETKKLVGAKTDGLVRVPGADAKPEDLAAFRTALGVPDAAAKYELTAPDLDGTPMTFDATRLNHWRGVFHELGLTPPQAQGLVNAFAAEGKTFIDTQGQAWAQELRDLRGQWGDLRFTRSAEYARRAIDRFGSDSLKMWLDDTRIGDHPELFKMFAQIGEQFAEDGVIPGEVQGIPTDDELGAQLAALRTQQFEAAQRGDDREADRLIAELRRLSLLRKGATRVVAEVG